MKTKTWHHHAVRTCYSYRYEEDQLLQFEEGLSKIAQCIINDAVHTAVSECNNGSLTKSSFIPLTPFLSFLLGSINMSSRGGADYAIDDEDRQQKVLWCPDDSPENEETPRTSGRRRLGSTLITQIEAKHEEEELMPNSPNIYIPSTSTPPSSQRGGVSTPSNIMTAQQLLDTMQYQRHHQRYQLSSLATSSSHKVPVKKFHSKSMYA